MAVKLTDEQIERQCIEEVFGLGGGELEDRPLVFLDAEDVQEAKDRASDMTDVHSRPWWYEGVPDYEEHYGRNRNETFWNTYITIVSDCLYGAEPDRIVTSDGRVWKRVTSYTGSGERECPYRAWDPIGREDYQGKGARVVDEQEAVEEYAWCPLCEEKVGEEHGYIYLGEGWTETIYEQVQQHEVVVGNIGTVYSGEDREEAKRKFGEYRRQSEQDEGCRAWGESVTWMVDGEIEDEIDGHGGEQSS